VEEGEQAAVYDDEDECAQVSVGEALLGRIVDYSGLPVDGRGLLVDVDMLGLWRRVPEMDERRKIDTPLHTGVTAVDVIAPIGRGQSMLVIGGRGAGKTTLALDMILAQAGQGVKCVYCALSQGPSATDPARSLEERQAEAIAEAEAVRDVLEERGALGHCALVATRPTLGGNFLAAFSAIAIAEHYKDAGEDTLVVLDNFSSHVDSWMAMGSVANRRIMDGLKMETLMASSDDETEAGAGAEAGAEAGAGAGAGAESQAAVDADVLVEFQGTLGNRALADTRRFYSILLQRSACMHPSQGGGSLTLVACCNQAPKDRDLGGGAAAAEYAAKLQAKLGSGAPAASAPGAIGREMADPMDDLISVSDGMIYLDAGLRDAGQLPAVDPTTSLSRTGGAMSAPFRALAPTVRLELAQAKDMMSLGDSFGTDNASRKQRDKVILINRLLKQPPRTVVSTEAQLLGLHAVMRGACVPASADRITDALLTGDIVAAVAGSPIPDTAAALDALRRGAALSQPQAKALDAALTQFFTP